MSAAAARMEETTRPMGETFRAPVVFATAERSPLASTGGLGEVAAALPRALAALGVPVSVFLPYYDAVRAHGLRLTPVAWIAVPGHGEGFPVLRAESAPGEADLYLIEHEGFFRRSGLYGDSRGEYADNVERFSFFSRAVLEATIALGLRPRILHCNDWHTGLVGAYLRTLYSGTADFRDTALVFTIHNLAYQGRYPADRLGVTGLPGSVFRPEWLEYYGQMNFLKSGIAFANAVTTVSPRYAAEITTPEFGEGLDGLLRFRRHDLHGILNGIDTERWNPATDPLIPARYGPTDLSGKRTCRESLLEELGLRIEPETPIVAMVTRLTWQKGCDLVLGGAPALLRVGSPPGRGAAFVMLGSGDAALEQGFRDFAGRHPDRVSVRIGFDEAMAHRIEAGADIFLMPSRYEPCGLNQMYSLRYGTVPVVRACGGLHDTVRDVTQSPEVGNGFRFRDQTPDALLGALGRAFSAFRNPGEWRRIQKRGMEENFSWERSATRYAQLYARLAGKR